MPNRINPSFVIFDIRVLWRSFLSYKASCVRPAATTINNNNSSSSHELQQQRKAVTVVFLQPAMEYNRQCNLW